MSMYDVYVGQGKNRANIVKDKLSDLMNVVKNHPSMKKYSPAIRKQAQIEISELLRHKIDTLEMEITASEVNNWLDNYTPYAQASTTAYIQRVAKEKGYKTFSSEQVAYVKEALLKSMEPEETFVWDEASKGSKNIGTRLPLRGKALGTERDLAAKVATHVDWAVKKTVKNILTPEGVIEFLAKHEKDLIAPIDEDNLSTYVDNIISEAKRYLYNANDKKITPKTIANINNELLFAILNANVKVKDYSGALLKKLGTSTFVDNDTRLAEIKNQLDKKIGARKNSERDKSSYEVLYALMERFFKAVRWSMKYKVGKLGSSGYTAANHYPKVELAIREFVANTPLSAKELINRFNKIFQSNDNPEAVERLYMAEVFNSWWPHVSKVLGLDEDVSVEILSDVISDKTVDYTEWNKTNFERDLDKEAEIKKTFARDSALDKLFNGNIPNRAEENKKREKQLLDIYAADKEQKQKVKEQKKEEKQKVKKEKQKVEEQKQKITYSDIEVTNLDKELKELRKSTSKYLQQTTSRIKKDVIKKSDKSDKVTKDFIAYRAEKRTRHKEIVIESIEDFITTSNHILDEWEKEAKEKAEEKYANNEKAKAKEIRLIEKYKRNRRAKIKEEAMEMKKKEVEKFHNAVYTKKDVIADGKEK